VLQLLADHPDVYMIPDPKYARPEIYRAYVRQAAAMGRLDLLERVMPHVADQAELDALRAYYPLRNYVLALYHSQAHNRMDDAAAVDFVRRNRVPAVMLWWRDRDPSLSLAANGRQGRRYRPELTAALRAAGAVTYVHSLAGPADISASGTSASASTPTSRSRPWVPPPRPSGRRPSTRPRPCRPHDRLDLEVGEEGAEASVVPEVGRVRTASCRGRRRRPGGPRSRPARPGSGRPGGRRTRGTRWRACPAPGSRAGPPGPGPGPGSG